VPRGLEAFYGPVRRNRRNRQPRTDRVDGLMVPAVDRDFAGSGESREPRPRRDPDGVGAPALVPGAALVPEGGPPPARPGLDEGAAPGDVHDLKAPADAEDRSLGGPGPLEEREIRGVALEIDFHLRVRPLGLAVARRLDVDAAPQNHAVEGACRRLAGRHHD